MSEMVDTTCPNCHCRFEVSEECDGEAECPCCAWEFEIDWAGGWEEDGECDTSWLFEIDADGELVPVEIENPWEVQVPQHEERNSAGDPAWEEWDYYPEEDDYEGLAVYHRSYTSFAPVSLACPNCGHRFRDPRPGDPYCPGCGLAISMSNTRRPDGGPAWNAEATAPAPGEDPPTVVVSRCGTKDFTSLADAVESAPAGTRILVRPGVYQESIEVNESIEIVGDGEPDEVIIVGTEAPCLRLIRGPVVLRNLTLRGSGKKSGQELPALEIYSGGPVFVADCVITSDTLACVDVSTKYTDVLLRSCWIHDGASAGVRVSAGGRVRTIDGGIVKCAGPGITTDGTAYLTLFRTRISENGAEGVLLRTHARLVLTRCDVFGNAGTGVVLRGNQALVWRSAIHDNGGDGIFIEKWCPAGVEECDIHDNAGDGIAVLAADPTVRDCVIRDGKRAGVRVMGKGMTRLQGCEVYGNDVGVSVRAPGRIEIANCSVYANRTADVPDPLSMLPPVAGSTDPAGEAPPSPP